MAYRQKLNHIKLDLILHIYIYIYIIIKPADKGSAVVVMDKTTYIQEAERQMSDCRFYEKFDSDPTLDFTQKIMWVLEVCMLVAT